MSKSIRFFDFHGITPRLDETLLDATSAMVAEDVDLGRGDLQPWRWATSPVASRNLDIKTMVDSETTCGFITWDSIIDVDLGQPVCSDIGMMFWIEDGVVYQATRSEACQGIKHPLGVPCPTQAPSGGSGEGAEGCVTVEAYRYTYVNQYGQEGPPSPASTVSTSSDGSASISIPSGPSGYTVNVYRATADASSGLEGSLSPDGAWLKVGEGSPGSTITTNPLSKTSQTLRSTRWSPPPTGVTALSVCPASNTLFLAKDNKIFISHPGQYHAFPRDRDLVLQDNVVSMRDYSSTMIILTDGHPYTIVPRSLREGAFIYDVDRFDDSIPCVSKASVSVGIAGVIWASNDGLFTISKGRYGIRAICLSSTLFHLNDWRDSEPETIRGEVHNGAYYFTCDGEVTCSITDHKSHTWVLTYNDEVYEHPENVLLTSLSIRPLMWHKTRRDVLYYSLDNKLYEWNPKDGEVRPYTYITRDTVLEGLTSLGAAKVHHDGGGLLDFSIWKEVCTNPRLVYGRKLSHCQPFRLPLCLHTIHQYVKLVGVSRVRSVHLATSIIDLTNHSDATYNYGNSRLTQRR